MNIVDAKEIESLTSRLEIQNTAICDEAARIIRLLAKHIDSQNELISEMIRGME